MPSSTEGEDREFFTRCHKCHEDFPLNVKVLADGRLLLSPVRCEKHPNESTILFPTGLNVDYGGE